MADENRPLEQKITTFPKVVVAIFFAVAAALLIYALFFNA